MLQIDALNIDIADPLPDDVQRICTEAAWTRFVASALAFPHLRYVQLLRRWDPARVLALREPAFLGITDAVFKPLIDAGKFLCLLVRRPGPWEVVLWAADTVDPKPRKRPPASEPEAGPSGHGGGSRERDAEEKAEGAGANAEGRMSECSSCLSRLAGIHKFLARFGTSTPAKDDALHEHTL